MIYKVTDFACKLLVRSDQTFRGEYVRHNIGSVPLINCQRARDVSYIFVLVIEFVRVGLFLFLFFVSILSCWWLDNDCLIVSMLSVGGNGSPSTGADHSGHGALLRRAEHAGGNHSWQLRHLLVSGAS